MALVPFNLYYSETQHDNFTTATEQGRLDAEASDYRCVRDEGSIYDKQVSASVPLRLYYSKTQHDNFTTATEQGRLDAEASGYKFVRIEGYIAPRGYSETQLLELSGTASLDPVTDGRGIKLSAYPDGSAIRLSFHLVLKNKTAQPVAINRANLFYVSQGGWLEAGSTLVNERASTKFFGYGPLIAASAEHEINQTGYEISGPVTHLAFQLYCTTQGGKKQDLFKSIPIQGSTSAWPANSDINHTLFIGLQEPVEVIDLDTGPFYTNWITVIAQVVNGTGKPQKVQKLSVSVKSWEGAKLVEKDLSQIKFFVDTKKGPKLDSMDKSTALAPRFLVGGEVPAWFTKLGRAEISIEARVDGRCHRLQRAALLSHISRDRALYVPVKGQWKWGGGPGALDHGIPILTHHSWPGSRYCYDLSIWKDGSPYDRNYDWRYDDEEQRDKMSALLNESYYCWKKEIYCMEEGEVVEVDDKVPDNKGNTGKLPNGQDPPHNAKIVVEHKNNQHPQYKKWYSVYAHVNENSAKVRPGDKVHEGDVLALVGNAGYTTGPHLHIGYYFLNHDGRIRSYPMCFKDLRSLNGQLMFRVPRDGIEYKS